MGIFLIIIFIIILLWPWISRWLQRMAMNRMEDFVRRASGRPSRKEERRRMREEHRRESHGHARGAREDSRPRRHPARLMQLVAVDVEFVEIKTFTSATIDPHSGAVEYEIIIEEQISDVEFTEIKA